jgi:hypothetical protein
VHERRHRGGPARDEQIPAATLAETTDLATVVLTFVEPIAVA